MQRFVYHLHDNTTSAERRAFLEMQGIKLSEEAWEKMGRPFYEVTLECEVDGDGNVTVKGLR